jgi:hypothetical protein
MIPLPPSPELEPFVITTDGTNTPDTGIGNPPALTRTATPAPSISTAPPDQAVNGSSSAVEAAKPKTNDNLSLFNTPRNRLPTSASSTTSLSTAINVQGAASPSSTAVPASLPTSISSSDLVVQDAADSVREKDEHVVDDNNGDGKTELKAKAKEEEEDPVNQQETNKVVPPVVDNSGVDVEVGSGGDGGTDKQDGGKVVVPPSKADESPENGKSYANTTQRLSSDSSIRCHILHIRRSSHIRRNISTSHR